MVWFHVLYLLPLAILFRYTCIICTFVVQLSFCSLVYTVSSRSKLSMLCVENTWRTDRKNMDIDWRKHTISGNTTRRRRRGKKLINESNKVKYMYIIRVIWRRCVRYTIRFLYGCFFVVFFFKCRHLTFQLLQNIRRHSPWFCFSSISTHIYINIITV